MGRLICIDNPSRKYPSHHWRWLPVVGEFYTVVKFYRQGEQTGSHSFATYDSYHLLESPENSEFPFLHPADCFAVIDESEEVEQISLQTHTYSYA